MFWWTWLLEAVRDKYFLFLIRISCYVFSHCPSWWAFHPSPLCPAPSGIQFGLADGGAGRRLECSAGGSSGRQAQVSCISPSKAEDVPWVPSLQLSIRGPSALSPGAYSNGSLSSCQPLRMAHLDFSKPLRGMSLLTYLKIALFSYPI